MSDSLIVDTRALAQAGASPLSGRFRVEPSDFEVAECLTLTFDEAGEHLWLWVEKTGLTTDEAVKALALAAGVARRDIGYAGMKDKHAVTRQWFSLPWPIKAELPVWPDTAGLVVRASHRHGRKLKRGAHHGNRFRIRLRALDGVAGFDAEALGARLIREGVPNYFGAQRFGRDGANVEMARTLFAGQRLPRQKRNIALSAARAFLFNQVLDARVRDGSWQHGLAGDVFMLDGTNSVFGGEPTDRLDDTLAERLARHDIHPTGPLPGRATRGGRLPAGAVGERENTVLAAYDDLIDGLAEAGVDADRRALRLPVSQWECQWLEDDLLVSFKLPAGAFATSVLREIGDFTDARRP